MLVKEKKYGILALVIIATVYIAALVGWVLNLVKLFGLSTDDLGELILRIVGIFLAPIGAVAGYF